MHRARLTIDLPSEELPPDPAVLAVLRWIFTTGESKALERITGTGLSWCQRLLAASAHGGLTEVIAIVADDRELYLDEQQRGEDFVSVLQAIAKPGGLEGGFGELRIVLSGNREGWHAVADIRLRTQVEKGVPEIEVHWSARSLELRVAADEDALAYGERIATFAGDATAATAAFSAPERMLDDLLARWTKELAPSVVAVASRRRLVVVPGPTQVGRFRRLGFGKALRGRSYRPRAAETRTGAYDEPHVYYYFDPYHDLLSWLVAQHVASGHWQGPTLEMVDRNGEPLAASGTSGWEVPVDAVTVEAKRVLVDDRVPQVHGIDVAEAGSPGAPGFAGGNDDG